MIHLGDINKISGFDAPVVDIITGGSPCQDLSVAGKRAGLAGERSGLFMEQIRIIKEMREKERRNGRTNDAIRPRYMVWENVPGAFSSNKGEDFRAVLEETAKVAERDACIPGSPNGKWSSAGCIMGDGWSIAWRVHDAQFWGVPQRRKRIALVADFGGETAPEILFERKGLSRDIAPGGKEGERTSGNTERCAGETGTELIAHEKNHVSMVALTTEITPKIDDDGVAFSLRRDYKDPQSVCYSIDQQGGNPNCNQDTTENHAVAYRKKGHPQNAEQGQGWEKTEVNDTLNAFDSGEGRTPTVILENHPADSRVRITEDNIVQTLSSRMGTGGGNVPMVMETCAWDGTQVSPTLTANNAGGNQRMSDKDNFNAVSFGNGQLHDAMSPRVEVSKTLNCVNDFAKIVTYGLDRASFNQGENAKFDFSIEEEKIGAQVARGPGAVCQSVVRRLTPLECERLQGYPDYWTDIGDWVDSKGKKHKGDSDSPRYKALGNSIALPFWKWMAKRMVKYLDIEHATYSHHPTMASLFDGIGGFPIAYSEAGCEPVWASEIEEFPIAVTKIRFPE